MGRIDYTKLLLNTQTSDGKKTSKYKTKHPYYEDKESYNLDSCIAEQRKPMFGYPLTKLNTDLNHTMAPEDEDNDFEFDFMKPNVVELKRQKQYMDHVLKCFTFGHPVRRDEPLVKQGPSAIDEIKRKFNRVFLIRKFFSVKRSKANKKFDYPVDHMGRILADNITHEYQ